MLFHCPRLPTIEQVFHTKYSQLLQSASAEASSVVAEALRSFRVVAAFGGEGTEAAR
jgi:hypothetical protein